MNLFQSDRGRKFGQSSSMNPLLSLFGMERASQEANRGKEGEQEKATGSPSVAFSCLGTSALPCAGNCKEQVLSWTQEGKE